MDLADQVRDAFKKVKEDMDSLRQEISQLALEFKEIKEIRPQSPEKTNLTDKPLSSTDSLSVPTTINTLSAEISLFKPQKDQNMDISTGNEGVPTNRQTNQQTDQQTQKRENSMENALKLLNSLDSVKKEIRLRFKELTEQEFLVFSTLYQMEDQGEICDYKVLSKRLNLSESSVRDYIGKLIKKDIPVEKVKIKNKNVQLSLSSDLKKAASLSTILQLRDL